MKTNKTTTVLEKIERSERKEVIQTILIFPFVILVIILTKIYQNDFTVNRGEILFVSAVAIGIIIVLFLKIRNASSNRDYYRKFLKI